MTEETVKCPNCGTENSTNDAFCKECGTLLPKKSEEKETTKKLICPACGTEYIKGTTFCAECGKKLDDSQSVSTQSFNIAQYGDLTLTKDYVKQYISFIGKQYSAHIFLKDVSCIEIGFKSKPWPLWLGIPLLLAFGAGLILIILYFILRKHTLIITSNGGAKITQIVVMGTVDNANQFVGSLVMAKKNILDAKR